MLLDIPPMAEVLSGVHFELMDCALPNLVGRILNYFLCDEQIWCDFLLTDVEAVTTEEQAFKDIDYAFLVGAMPRKEGWWKY